MWHAHRTRRVRKKKNCNDSPWPPHWHVTSHPHGIVGIACRACTQNMISKQQERVTYLVTESHVEKGRESQSGQE